MDHPSTRRFLQVAALCSLLGALTTALLIFLPNPPAADFDAQVLLHKNRLYLNKLWILFLHPQVNIIASLGVAYVLARKYPASIIFGTLFLLIWAYTEMSQQALLIDGLNQIWRPGYMAAGDEANKQLFKTLIRGAGGFSDSKYFLVIYSFGLGSLLYGLAMTQLTGLGRWLGVALLFIGLLSLASFGRYYLGLSSLNGFADFSYAYIYPYLQPLVRVGIAVWLWKVASGRMEIA